MQRERNSNKRFREQVFESGQVEKLAKEHSDKGNLENVMSPLCQETASKGTESSTK